MWKVELYLSSTLLGHLTSSRTDNSILAVTEDVKYNLKPETTSGNRVTKFFDEA